MRFDWQTEQESTVVRPPQERRWWRLSRRRRWLLSVLGLAALSFSLVGWLGMRRLEARRTALREDIMATHRLWEQALVSDDQELFSFLLARRDLAWQQTQGRSFNAGVVIDRAPLGLHLKQLTTADLHITFAPDWQSAELSSMYVYEPDEALNLREAVTLQHTAVYCLQDNRWVQSAPDKSFWGPQQTATGARLTLHYPERDMAIAQRLFDNLETDLQLSCDKITAERAASCPAKAHMVIELSTDPATLAGLPDLDTPLFNGRTMLLPTPSLTGVPMGDIAYEAFYRGYMGRVLKSFATNMAAPIPLPEQSVYTLCFSYPSKGLTLRKYDPVAGVWTAVTPERAYRFLAALPDNGGLLLQEAPSSADANHLRLLRRQNGAEQVLVDDDSRQWQPRPIGWASSGSQPRLLLQGADLAQATTFYQLLDLQACQESGCKVTDLPGFTMWSPDGETTTSAKPVLSLPKGSVQAVTLIDSTLYLADEQGNLQQPVGTGFNPFWLNETTLGFVRFAKQASLPAQAESPTRINATTTELVTLDTHTLQETVLFNADALARAADIDQQGVVFIKYATISPTDSQLLLIAATGVSDYAGQFFIFVVRLLADGTAVAKLRLQHDGAPNGYPSLLTPTGYPPFHLSPDGRWLVLSELTDQQANSWTFQLHNIEQNSTELLTANFPAYPARYPFYNWSPDGQWLLIVDDGFIRLVAPEYGYQRLIPHEFDSCLFTAWAN